MLKMLIFFRPVYNPNEIDRDDSYEAPPEPITAESEFFSEVDSPTPHPKLPYIVYSNEENPWSVMDTKHLYKRSGTVSNL